MTRSTSYSFSSQGSRGNTRTARDAADYLRSHDRMAALLPAAARMATLQRDCAAILPAAFDACAVVQFDTGRLVLALPNSALAAKLKQQLPFLQEELLKRGWQISTIRLKLQVVNIVESRREPKRLALPETALASIAALRGALEDSPRNAALKAALNAMLKRHRQTPK